MDPRTAGDVTPKGDHHASFRRRRERRDRHPARRAAGRPRPRGRSAPTAPGQRRARQRPRGGAGAARPARPARRARASSSRPRRTRSSTRRPRCRTCATSQHFDRTLRGDQPAADGGHRRAARRRAGGRRAPVRRPELRQRPLRARGRAGQDRGRPARPRPRSRRCARRTPRCATSTAAVTDAGGIALRYGGFYGAANDGLVEPVRKRQFPIVGDGGGVMSFIHLDDAAAATVLALDHDGAGIYNIVDDEPAPDPRVAAGARGGRSAPSRRATSPAGSRGSSRARRR